MREPITALTIRQLLGSQDDYLIPMYQRNYAWGEWEITQLIQDVVDYAERDGSTRYFIGTLVVFERNQAGRRRFETIDGQQRLTTLSLLTAYLKHSGSVDCSWYTRQTVLFESRAHSRKTLQAIFNGTSSGDPRDALSPDERNEAILKGYLLIEKILPRLLGAVSEERFAAYLFDRVQLMRVQVPPDTDLNHYFEIMNNRGEQLEKHEVLKAKLMDALGSAGDRECLHRVWEACANMERYVQMSFTPRQRSVLFGDDWGLLKSRSFDVIREILAPRQNSAEARDAVSLDDVFARLDAAHGPAPGGPGTGNQERFSTVINFPNFLLHVLRVMLRRDVPLDDKRLLDTFRVYLLEPEDSEELVKRFVVSLLQCKNLFDHYIIKRAFPNGQGRWILKRLKKIDRKPSYANTFDDDGGKNLTLLMLLSAFHVSTPTMIYKHWLNAALSFLYHRAESAKIKHRKYLAYLEGLARAFLFDRFLVVEGEGGASRAEYFDIIYRRGGKCRRRDVGEEALSTRLSYGVIENNLIFNYLDYLLWKQSESPRERAYEFTFRSSVEHYYPQRPMPGHDSLPERILNDFGNLCLISHSKNSRLSNYMPAAKKEHYRGSTIDSIKQHRMMQVAVWDTRAILKHGRAMRQVLLADLEP